MAAKHDVQDLGTVSLKLPDGQELELPLLKVSCHYRIEICLEFSERIFLAEMSQAVMSFVRTLPATGSWMSENYSQRR